MTVKTLVFHKYTNSDEEFEDQQDKLIVIFYIKKKIYEQMQLKE
jgi:hypothetical protein